MVTRWVTLYNLISETENPAAIRLSQLKLVSRALWLRDLCLVDGRYRKV